MIKGIFLLIIFLGCIVAGFLIPVVWAVPVLMVLAKLLKAV